MKKRKRKKTMYTWLESDWHRDLMYGLWGILEQASENVSEGECRKPVRVRVTVEELP